MQCTEKSLQYYNKGIVGFILLLCHVTFVASGQTFDGTTGQIIDFNNEAVPTVFNIDVSLTQQKIDQTYGLERVCIDINHKRASDLKIELISPDGTTFWLSNRNGEENRYGYFNTCFSANGFDGYIYDAKYNLEGTFTPEGKMDFVNNSQNPNGRWFLSVTDLRNGVIGKVRSISLTFGNNPAFSSAGPCSFASPKNCYSSPLSNGELLPDLIVVPALTTGHIKYYRPNDPDTLNRNQLRFAAAMANVGEGPFEIHSGQIWKCGDSIVNKTDRCQDGNLPSATVYQQIYIKKGEEMKMDAHPGGHLYFDNSPGHNHYHVADWVDFVLLKKRWWTGNPLKWKVVAKSTKVSYCLFDNLNCNAQNNYCQEKTINHTEHTLQNYGFGHFASCESAKQGISVGGIDYYGINYEGQSILLPSDIKKGEYSLMIHIDPLKKYREKSTANNIFITEVIID